ncbi:hypothetical protein QYE76_049073 [Lolium multiflorum]|uniref:Uncharacterized protein n=1 Tax=Lolium multiflorum TaxID=4521 RepID=A0AAD8SNL9_LOLMU|nr:hypothetical protein QYE76_049073 [Lolium multiflorum]
MENYSLLMGATAVMKMAVEMAAVSMEKPSGGTSPSGRVPEQNSCPPDLGFDDGGCELFVSWLSPVGPPRAAHEIIVLKYIVEINHIATGTAPSLDGELLPPHGSSSGDEDGGGDGSGVDGEAFGHFPVRGAGTETLSPDLGFAMTAALELFSYRGFLRKGFDARGFK